MPSLGLNYYPFNSPIVLTDVIYEEYGGSLANTTKAQRQAAYWIAEQDVSTEIDTFLTRTIVTGTYAYGARVQLEHSNVHSVLLIRYVDFEETIFYTISGTANVYASLWDAKRGIVDIALILRNCACTIPGWNNLKVPYQLQIIYDTGLPSGTVYRPDVLLGLSTYAGIIINEIVGWGNEAPGDAGISEFSNQNYREKRKGLLNTTFGQSPKANFVRRMLNRLKEYRYVGL